jgi:hypothetical protein
MSKTYRFQSAKKAMAKGYAPEEVERSLRGKLKRRNEQREKREDIRRMIKEGVYE